jgi:hypothetical protein
MTLGVLVRTSQMATHLPMCEWKWSSYTGWYDMQTLYHNRLML